MNIRGKWSLLKYNINMKVTHDPSMCWAYHRWPRVSYSNGVHSSEVCCITFH